MTLPTIFETFAAGAACKPESGSGGLSLVPTWYQYLDGKIDETGRCSLGQAFTFPDDLGAVGLGVLDILLRVSAYVAIGFVIYGGIMYMTSQGEPDKAKNARDTIINALIGLVIAILAASIVSFIGRQLVS